jgi:hypothetical protein
LDKKFTSIRREISIYIRKNWTHKECVVDSDPELVSASGEIGYPGNSSMALRQRKKLVKSYKLFMSLTKPSIAMKAKAAAKPVARQTVKPRTPAAAKPSARVAVKGALQKNTKNTTAVKPAKPPKPPVVALPKVKLVRDSFTLPESDHDLIKQCKKTAIAAGRETKKSEVVRAAIRAFCALPVASQLEGYAALQTIAVGRPKGK